MFHIVTSVDIGGRYEQFLPLFLHLWRLAAPTAQIHVDVLRYDSPMCLDLADSSRRLENMLPLPYASPPPMFHMTRGDGLRHHRDVHMPIASAAKARRLLRACGLPPDDIVMLVDVDMVPISFMPDDDAVQDAIKKHRLVSVGGDAYEDKYHFPICYLFARSQDWNLIASPLVKDLDDLCRAHYSDELALQRRIEALLNEGSLHESEIAILPRFFNGGTGPADRINRGADFCQYELQEGAYSDAHLKTASDNCIPSILEFHKKHPLVEGKKGVRHA